MSVEPTLIIRNGTIVDGTGAFGFSTSRTISRKSLAGDYTPTLRAQEEELTGVRHAPPHRREQRQDRRLQPEPAARPPGFLA